jgi:hypothetical protein
MHSKVAEAVRQEQIEEIRQMTPDERVALALHLGDRDLQIYMSVQGIDIDTAVTTIRQSHQVGRRFSRCMQESA